MLSGSVAHKRLKRDLGELAWAIPALNDVQNKRHDHRAPAVSGEP